MKVRALSHYGGDSETRYGDCILIMNYSQLIIYDCGHDKHAEEIEYFLKEHSFINEIYIVISHNDSDHTDGVVSLIEYLSVHSYKTTVYTSLYLKYSSEVEKIINDGRRNQKSICDHILGLFDHIAEIVNTANACGFLVKDAIEGTIISDVDIVGPSKEEFIEVVAKAIEGDGDGTIDGETVMNAASVQLKVKLDNGYKLLLCGDASPQYLKNLDNYDVIQFPHHGQYKDGVSILEVLDDPYTKVFLISDNTGSGNNSGGSKELVEYMKTEKYNSPHNTLNGVINLPESIKSAYKTRGVILGGFYTQY